MSIQFNYEEQIFSIINDALFNICEEKPSNPIESLSAKMFQLIGEDPSEILKKRRQTQEQSKSVSNINDTQSCNHSFSALYKIVKKIGHGSYGTVFTTQLRNEQANANLNSQSAGLRSVKIIKKNVKHLSESNRELLKKLDHPNIVKIHEVMEDDINIYIVMEYFPLGDLYSFIKKRKILGEQTAKVITQQVLSALSMLHSSSIIHRDIKPENVLISEIGAEVNGEYPNIHIKLIDFGSATFFDKDKKLNETIGSPYYIAPEVLAGNYSFSCDLWSCGILHYVMLCGIPPFMGRTHSIIYKIINNGHIFTQAHSEEAQHFLNILLVKDPKDRIKSAAEALDNPYLNTQTKEEESHNKVLALEAMNSMKNFWQGNSLRRLIISYISEHRLYQEDNNNCARVFQDLDKNHDGQLDSKEIIKFFRDFFVGTEEEELEKVEDMVKNIDVNGNGKIDYSEFMIVTSKFHKDSEKRVLNEIFDAFDEDGSGFIESQELKEILQDACANDQEFNKLLEEIDSNGDGKLSKEEFVDMIVKYY